ncbi:MAG: HD domain-containing protein [Desulfurococcaceae archaeon]
MPNEDLEKKMSLLPLFNGQVRDSIYGYIDYNKEIEGSVMDSWALQRLRYILQLQAAHLVYPSATHTRFSHAIGFMHLSYKYISFLLKTISQSDIFEEYVKESTSKFREIIIATRLLGLLHDIGHGPFSHAFDKYVYRTRNFLEYRVGNHEVVGYLIYRDYIRGLLEKTLLENKDRLNLDIDYLLMILDAGMKPPSGMRSFTDLVSKGVLNSNEFYAKGIGGFEVITRMIVRDYIYTSDIMDYLKRDSHFTSVPIGQINDEWIIRNSYILSKDGQLTIGVSSKALDEVARLFDARKYMYKHVYLHPVNVAFIETIGYLLGCLKEYIADVLDSMFSSPDHLSRYITLTDHSLYSHLQELLIKGINSSTCEDREFARMALESLFYQRKPVWKLVKRFTYDLEDAKMLFGEIGERIQEAMIQRIKEELSSKYSGRGITENDVYLGIDKIDVFPSASMELMDKVEIIDIKDGKIVYRSCKTFTEFALDFGLKSEVLISLYINRKIYKTLLDKDVEDIIGTAESVIKSIIRGKKIEPPETS